jgi:hypothetical protein
MIERLPLNDDICALLTNAGNYWGRCTDRLTRPAMKPICEGRQSNSYEKGTE